MRAVLLPLLGAVCFSGSFAAPDYCAISPQNTLCLYSACTFSSTCNRPMPVAVTAEDKKTIEQFHNQLRFSAVVGELRDLVNNIYPTASNMRRMFWDDELAKMAQAWVNQCKYEHDTNRDVPRFHVGQNIYKTWTDSENLDTQRLFREAIMLAWKVGSSDFDPAILNSFPANYSVPTGNLIQILWADTYKVGCGISMSYNNNTNPTTDLILYDVFIACNYGPAGNLVGQPVYQVGPPGSNCPPGTTASDYLCA